MDALLALATLAAVGYFLVWKDFLEPLIKGQGQRSRVKSSPPLPAYRARSRRSAGSNVVNGGSALPAAPGEGSNVQNVQPAIAPPAAEISPGAPAGEAFTLTPRELQQLADALAARATGATVEEALARGFSVKKGGSAGYKRAKELFDLATKAP
jgi:hypothetical protein